MGRRLGRGHTWSQQALVLASMDSVCLGLNQEPGSHRGPVLGAQDPLPAPDIWRWPELTPKSVFSLWLLHTLEDWAECG